MKIMPTATTFVASALLAGLALVAAPSASAQINYQGRLTDAAGAALADGQYTLQFTLWDAATGGTQLWGPYLADGGSGNGHGPKAAVVDGRFNIVIGATDTNNFLLKDQLAASLTTYLQIQVGTSAPISPRQIILPAPRALVADVLPNVVPNATGVTLSGNAVVQGDATASTNQLVIRGKTEVAKELLLAYNTADGHGSIQAKDGATTKPLILNPAGGSVGIGKTNPESALDVNGAIKATSINGEKPPLVYVVGHNEDTTNFHSIEVPSEIIKNYLGDADGGTIRFIMRIVGNDAVRIIEEQFSYEQPDNSNNGRPGLMGASQAGTTSFEFTVDTTTKNDLISPLHVNWLWMRNYNSRNLTGLPGTDSAAFTGVDKYKVEFLTGPNVAAKIIIYDR